MTYHTVLSADGMVSLPDELTRALGLAPGMSVSVDQSGDTIVLRRNDAADEHSAALARLRAALKDYSVDQFLAERRADWGE